MPSVSKAQQKFMGLVHAYKKGEIPASKVSKAVKDAAKSMKKKSTKDFASTKHDDLPNKVKSESTKSYGKSLVKIAKDRQLKSLSKKDRETLIKISKMMKKANESVIYENPAASAAAAMVMMKLQNPSTGKKISAVTPLRDKDHPLHKKSKGIFQRLKDKFMKKNESVNEDGHTDVASAERKLKLIMKDAMDTLNALRNLSNEDSLPSWWTDKITLAKDYVGKSRDYITNPTENVGEGFGGDLKGSDKKKFEKARKENAEQLGYELTGTSDIKESVNEKKNPKREKAKKSFLKNLQKTEKTIRRIKQFAKSNQWGPISNFVEDDLVYDMMALKNEIDQIISMPVDESVNENAQKVAKLLIKRGNNPKDVKDMVKKHYKNAKKDRSKSTPSDLASYISFLSANESVNEAVEPTGNIKKVLDVVKNKQHTKIGGTIIDLTTAGMMTQVWDKVNDRSKEKMNKMNVKQLINLILKLWKKVV